VIQLGLVDGSRMQEGQRIGRVQRPQATKEFAYFYSLVTSDTPEATEFADKRRNFLEDNGYTVKVCHMDEWSSYCSERDKKRDAEVKGQLDNSEFQQKIIEAIHAEILDRERLRSDAAAGIKPIKQKTTKRKADAVAAINKVHKKQKKG